MARIGLQLKSIETQIKLAEYVGVYPDITPTKELRKHLGMNVKKFHELLSRLSQGLLLGECDEGFFFNDEFSKELSLEYLMEAKETSI